MLLFSWSIATCDLPRCVRPEVSYASPVGAIGSVYYTMNAENGCIRTEICGGVKAAKPAVQFVAPACHCGMADASGMLPWAHGSQSLITTMIICVDTR